MKTPATLDFDVVWRVEKKIFRRAHLGQSPSWFSVGLCFWQVEQAGSRRHSPQVSPCDRVTRAKQLGHRRRGPLVDVSLSISAVDMGGWPRDVDGRGSSEDECRSIPDVDGWGSSDVEGWGSSDEEVLGPVEVEVSSTRSLLAGVPSLL